MQSIAVIDYGMGNIRSVIRALEYVSDNSQQVFLTSNPSEILKADRIVFPGQGAAGDCMRSIRQHDLQDVIIEAANNRPFLGICMGMQVLMTGSEENGGTECLNYYSGQVKRFEQKYFDEPDERLKIPQMGWNRVKQSRSHPLWQGIDDHSWFYFVHSYYLPESDDQLQVGQCHYGLNFSAAIARDNVFAMQCHPEKSASAGLKLLSNFIEWDGQA